MAREPQVSRTLKTTKVNALCLDIVSCEPFNKEVILTGTYKDNAKLEKKVRELVDSETEKFVHIADMEVVETLYAMTEQDFIKYAKPMEARKSRISEDTQE